MGVLNLTPDSFTGNGLLGDAQAAVARAQQMEAEGADIIDIGGESTRPGAIPIPAQEELRRVMPVLERVAEAVKVPLSIDTYKAEVAARALKAGASLINDVWGLRRDLGLARLAAQKGVPIVLVHHQRGSCYVDLIAELLAGLRWSRERALEAGVPPENIILDPGIGFGKTPEQNLRVMGQLGRVKALGHPVLLGTSRKFFPHLPLDLRREGTAATVALGIAQGVDIVRGHEVAALVRACRVSDAILRPLAGEPFLGKEGVSPPSSPPSSCP